MANNINTPKPEDTRNALMSQLAFVAEYATTVTTEQRYTDSDYDYLGTALDLASALLTDDYDGTGRAAEVAQQAGYIGDSAPAEVVGYFARLGVE